MLKYALAAFAVSLSAAAQATIALPPIVVLTSPAVVFNTDSSGGNNPFSLDASRSFSPSGDPLAFAWDFNGDGIYNDAFTALVTIPQDYFASAPIGSSFTLCTSVTDTVNSLKSTGCASATSLGPAESAVPEPATWAMMLLGFGGIGFSMRRRKVSLGSMQAA